MLRGHGDRLIDTGHGQDAHRAARAVDEAQIGRHQVLDAIAEDGVGVASAELHQAVLARRLGLGGNGVRQAAREPLVAEFVDVLHA